MTRGDIIALACLALAATAWTATVWVSQDRSINAAHSALHRRR